MKIQQDWYQDKYKVSMVAIVLLLFLLAIFALAQGSKISDEDRVILDTNKEYVSEQLSQMQVVLNSTVSTEEKLQISSAILVDLREKLAEAREQVGRKARKEIIELQNEISVLENELKTNTNTNNN
jgi:hypothetical protein